MCFPVQSQVLVSVQEQFLDGERGACRCYRYEQGTGVDLISTLHAHPGCYGANNRSATFPPWGILHNDSRLVLFRGDWIGVYCRRSGIGMLLAKLQVHMSTS